jgi:plasmid stabilization system protein ParE
VSRYTLSADAALDLEEIVDFVAADSVEASRRVLGDLLAAMQQLADMPRMGHIRRDVAEDDVRFWVVHTYLIAYRAEVDPIQVLRVVSGYRDLLGLLR